MTIQEKNSKNFIAKKSLGQNFLHAPHVANTMIRAANIGAGSHVLEVGPGKGALTEKILSAGASVIAVEKDNRAVAFLQEKFMQEIETGRLEIIRGDILDFNPEDFNKKNNGSGSVVDTGRLACGEYIMAANIPYYITGEFLRRFLESPCQPKRMVLMVQKEVAKRITVNNHNAGISDGRKNEKESILSISVKVYGKPSYITTVPARYFRPVPNVDSAVLLIDNISKKFFSQIDEKRFFIIVKAGFAHKRKVLIKNLENIEKNPVNKEIIRKILEKIWQERGFSTKIRAEELTPDHWKAITTSLISVSIVAETTTNANHQ